ncbi:hypothetical protein ACM44_08670 [Chryseobacterium koreense CCUG 49689]|uniref:Uncharacterized protein n=1 Tax=Chryseobacterium koreense CCUG 49689 TaxID=1304281 RepID=A0A0J7LPM3_9FLAO|nr:hypothetical protein ACM44_08670 [Chryseobacterium koreense CCUG 49689]
MEMKGNHPVIPASRNATPPRRGIGVSSFLGWGGKDCWVFFRWLQIRGIIPGIIGGIEVRSIVFVHRDVLDFSGLVNDYGF